MGRKPVKKAPIDAEADDLFARSYRVTSETHDKLEQLTADHDTKLYIVMAAAIDAFDPSNNPAHQAILEKFEADFQAKALMKKLADLPEEMRRQILRTLAKK